MAFDFKYQVAVAIMHPSADAQSISDRLPGLSATRKTTAGDARVLPSGASRSAKVTIWDSSLHPEDWLHSANIPLDDFLRQRIAPLEVHQEVFKDLGQEGEVYLRIVLFHDSQHAVAVLEAVTLAAIARTGLALDLEMYGPDPT